MLYQKVRPTTLAEIAGNVSLKEGLLQVFEKKEKPHSFLFYGPSGCGKTTIARILATNLGCVDASIFEYNAANTRGIETIRKLIEEVYLMPLFGTQKAYILDECFLGETRVLVDYDKWMSIEEVVNSSFVEEVLSYDLNSGKILKKRIIKKMKRPLFGDIWKTYISDQEEVYKLSSTRNHKFYVVGKGYTRAEELVVGDKLIGYEGLSLQCYVCKECGLLFDNKQSFRKHHALKHSRGGGSSHHISGHCSLCGKNFNYLQGHMFLAHRASMEQKARRSEKISKSRVKFEATEKGKENRRRLSLSRMGQNNPIYHNGGIGLKKLLAYNKRRWSSLSEEKKEEQIKRFINAPKYKNLPNKPESAIISMNISNLNYVGDGTLFLTLKLNGEKIKKNPDFVVSGKAGEKTKKFVEVVDLEYWHKKDWWLISKAYLDSGFDVLLVDAKRVITDFEDVRSEIEAFANNHLVTVVEPPVTKSGRRSQKTFGYESRKTSVYNLEIEDTHNYFALSETQDRKRFLPILVSNSHQLTDTAQQALLKVLEDCPSYCYFFLCTTDPARLIDTIRNRCTKYQVGYLGQFEMQRLLEEVVKREKIDISEDVLLAVVVTSEGCPRAALVALEMVAGITDIDKAISLLTSGSTEDPTIIDLCNYLLKQPQLREASWKAALEVFSRVDNDSEAVRRSILKVLYNRLIGCSNREDAKDYSRLMQIFSRSTFYGGKYQLAALVAEACLARNNNA